MHRIECMDSIGCQEVGVSAWNGSARKGAKVGEWGGGRESQITYGREIFIASK